MITNEEILKEYTKCYSDKSRVYMIENYLNTYDATIRKKVRFELFPKQKEFLQNLTDYNNNIASKARQTGVTTTTAARVTCEIALADENSPETILIVANRLNMSQDLLKKITAFLDQLPRWFWGSEYYSPDPKSEKNKKSIYTGQNKNEVKLFNGCRICAVSSGESAARGISAVSWLIFDEAAFIDNGMTVYSQAVATTSTGGNIVMISTPNGKDKLYYETYNQARLGKNDFKITELKWYYDPRYNKNLKWLKTNETTGETTWDNDEVIDNNGSVKYNVDRWAGLIQDGYKPTSPWYVNMCNKLNNDSQKIAQELDVSFMGSANNVLPIDSIDMQSNKNVREPLYVDTYLKDMWIWKEPIEGHRYIISCDPSRGDAADNSVIEIIDIDGRDDNGIPILEQVAEYQGKRPGDELGEILFKYGQLYGNAFIVADSIGGLADAALLTLIRLGYKNLYYDDVNLKNYTVQSSTLKQQEDIDKLPGFHSSGLRFPMLSNFANLVRNDGFKIRSKRVISELDTWIFNKAGRMDHMAGSHDDTITCLALGLFVMEFSYNKLEQVKKQDLKVIQCWSLFQNKEKLQDAINKTDNKKTNNPLPFYTSKTLNSALPKTYTLEMALYGIKRF